MYDKEMSSDPRGATEMSEWRSIAWNVALEGREPTVDKYFCRSGLVRKDLLFQFTPTRARPNSKAVYNVAELTRCLRHNHGFSIAVVKPAAASNATGILFLGHEDIQALLCRKNPSVLSAVLNVRFPAVLQEFVPSVDPLTTHLCSIRVLVLCVGSLQVFVHTEPRVLVCADPPPANWEFLCGQPLHGMASNCSLNQQSSRYDAKVHNRRCVDVFPTAVSQAIEIVADLFATLVHEGRRYFFHTPSAYELFGFDFVVREDGTLVLLEVNPSPSPTLFGASSRHELLQDCPALQSVHLRNGALRNEAGEPGRGRSTNSPSVDSGEHDIDNEKGHREDAEGKDHSWNTGFWQICFTHHGKPNDAGSAQ